MKNQSITVSIQKLFPSIITILALCLGVTSIRYALDEKFNIAVALIGIAAFLDAIDGRIARFFNTTSEFGAQLDSLADLSNFGIAPSVIIYLWSLHSIPYKGIGWAIVLFYIICSTIRLARFNTSQISQNKIKKSSNYFSGLPMPGAAAVLLTPMMFSFKLFEDFSFISSYFFIAPFMLVISILMISKIPVYSAKKFNIHREKINLLLVAIAFIFLGIMLEPWIFLPILIALYILFIPLAVFFFK